MASFYSLYSNDINLDTDDETTGLRLPSGDYDIPVVIGDKTFDQDGQMFFMLQGMANQLGKEDISFLKPFM